MRDKSERHKPLSFTHSAGSAETRHSLTDEWILQSLGESGNTSSFRLDYGQSFSYLCVTVVAARSTQPLNITSSESARGPLSCCLAKYSQARAWRSIRGESPSGPALALPQSSWNTLECPRYDHAGLAQGLLPSTPLARVLSTPLAFVVQVELQS